MTAIKSPKQKDFFSAHNRSGKNPKSALCSLSKDNHITLCQLQHLETKWPPPKIVNDFFSTAKTKNNGVQKENLKENCGSNKIKSGVIRSQLRVISLIEKTKMIRAYSLNERKQDSKSNNGKRNEKKGEETMAKEKMKRRSCG